MSNLPYRFPENTADDLAAQYVVGAMTPDERAELESCLAHDAELRAALASYGIVCEALIDQIEPVEPDESVLQSLLSRIDDEEAVGDGAASDDSAIVIHPADAEDWRESGVPGVSMRVLNTDVKQQRMTALVRFQPGASYPAHSHKQDEECLVLEGDLDFGDHELNAGDYLRMAAGTEHGIARSRNGCVCLVIMALPDSLVA